MPRAAIPYDELEKQVKKMVPYPTFRLARFRKPTRQNDVRAPQTIYSRVDGKFTVIGYKVSVIVERFTGFSDDLQRGIFDQERKEVIVQIYLIKS